ATDIYNQVIGQSNITMGATVGILLVIPSIISFLVDKKISKSVVSVDSSAKDYIIGKNKIRDSILGGITYLTSILILILVIAVIAAAFIKQWPYDLSFTFKWFKVSPIGISTLNIFINTIFVALISSVLGTIIAILAAYVTERGTGFEKIRKALDWFGILPLAIPGLVIGVSYLLFFNQSSNPLRVLYGTFVIMIFANIIHFFSMPYMTIKGSMKKIDKEYENVSETMGIPWYAVFDRVILPLSKQAVLESFQYYFLNSMVTISALVFLYTTRTNVAAVEMVSTYDEGYLSSTAAIAVLILLINIIVKYGITFYNKRKDISERDKEMEVYKILQVIQENEEISQRGIAAHSGISLGKVNYIMRDAIKKEYIKKEKCGNKIKYCITDKGFEVIKENIETLKEDVILISRDSDKKVKNAVILAAGFQKEFEYTPAGLKVIGGSVIQNAVSKLKRNGIENIYIVTGYGEEKIKADLKDEKNITFISSKNFKETGSMTSLALIDEYIDDDFILLEGDILFEERALIELLNSNKRECIVLTETSGSGDEEFVQSKHGYIFKLGKDIHQFNRVDGELVGISKISYKLYQLMMREYKENMNPLLNYEYILLDVSKDFKVFCLKLEGLDWGEIDNLEQYNLVKDKIFK
ncbi:winged helix-turn-helix transcriptional regulator, partial [Clostridium chrysemydis]|uniref:winged helix-turn-helix transcriptional regulator n=1 Tax=Clostridium chrysemydis TaxID=2665504 RepID=UPI003F4191B9